MNVGDVTERVNPLKYKNTDLEIGMLQSKLQVMEDINKENQAKIETLLKAYKKLESHFSVHHPEDTEVYEV